jgi:hypothetical protein
MLIGGLVGIGAMQVIDGLDLARPASLRN